MDPNPVEAIRDHRKYSKLVGTYAEALPKHIRPRTGRVHPNFNACVTNTARFASSDPNCQNIPTKGEAGDELRSAFIAELRKKRKLVVADYSQIELRVLAHVTQDPTLIAAFHAGQDMHSATAARLAGWSYGDFVEALKAENKKVTDLRKGAKTINFGIIYGMTAFGLAKQLKIDEGDAQYFIDQYFDAFPGVSAWIDQIQDHGEKARWVKTIYGRKLYLIQGMRSSVISYARRQASNYVIQGSAAELMRLALENAWHWYAEKELQGKILATVHDEIITEVPDRHAEEACWVLKRAMETAGGDWIKWRVPIIADSKIGDNWNQAK
jgi:DNA polymerase-1